MDGSEQEMHMTSWHDVIVIGAGVMGAATARALARSGIGVTIFEQFDVGHTGGSSHGRSRIFRLSYPDPMYVRMAVEAHWLWRELERERDAELLVITGGLDAGEEIASNRAALEECGVAYELMDGREAMRRWPQVSIDPDAELLFQNEGAYVAADGAVDAFLGSALDAGAKLMENARVERLSLDDGGGAVLSVGGDEIKARVVVVTAGSWVKGLLSTAGLDIDVRPTRETVAYFRFEGDLPPTLVEWGRPAAYALPAPGEGLKVGQHIAGPLADPDDAGIVSDESVQILSDWVRRRFPAADPTPLRAETCLYTNTPDEHFVLDRHGPIVVGSPCSGHGFKFAPLIGKRLAELAKD